jgi:hypothetical protein
VLLFDYLLHLSDEAAALPLPADASLLAEEVAATIVSFLTTDEGLLSPQLQRRVFEEWLQVHAVQALAPKTAFEPKVLDSFAVSVTCIYAPVA